MTLNELIEQAKIDMKFDDTELDRESLRIPQLHNKYLNFYHEEKLRYQGYKTNYSRCSNSSGNTIAVNSVRIS